MAEKRELLEAILSKYGFMDQHDFVSILGIAEESVTEDNQHFGSLMERLKVTFQKECGECTVVPFILKSKNTPNKNDVDIIQIVRAFPVEHKIYQDALKSMNDILKGEDNDDIPWPMYFGCQDNNLLLEDLKGGMALFAETMDEAREQILELQKQAGKIGLHISFEKTKIMTNCKYPCKYKKV